MLSEAAKKNGSKGVLPRKKNGNLNNEEMGLILQDIEGHSNQVKALWKKIHNLQDTIVSLREDKISKRQTCSSHRVVSMEIKATPSNTTGQSARETELESALKTALSESNKLRQRLEDTQRTQLELRKKIIQLE